MYYGFQYDLYPYGGFTLEEEPSLAFVGVITQIGRTYIDKVELDSASTNPVVVNRLPPPALPFPKTEAKYIEPYDLPVDFSLEITTDYLYAIPLNQAAVKTGNSAPYSFGAGDQLRISVDLVEYTITFVGTETTTADVISTVSDQLSTASIYSIADNTKLVIKSDTSGINSSVQILGGDANTVLGFDTERVAIADLYSDPDAATSLEVANVINSILEQGRAYAQDDKVHIYSNVATLSVEEEVVFAFLTPGLEYAIADKAPTLSFDVLDIGSAGFDTVVVKITDSTVTEEVIYDSSGPTVDSKWTLTQTLSQSIGASSDDIWHIELERSASYPFVSEDSVTVDITCSTLDPLTETFTHSFLIEDWEAPSVPVDGITSLSAKKLRVKFTESMFNDSTSSRSPLYVRNISGRVSYHSSLTIDSTTYNNVIQAPIAGFTSQDLDLFIGSYGAQNGNNNGYAQITEVLSSNKVTVDMTLTDELPADPEIVDPPSLYLSPYKVVRPTGLLYPQSAPIVIKAELPDEDILPSEDSQDQYVDLTFKYEFTPLKSYELEIVSLTDKVGNVIGSSYPFTAFDNLAPSNRDFDLWDTAIPQENKNQDATHDLEKLINTIDEVKTILLYDTDRFKNIKDPYAMPDAVVDTLLEHLGNPFKFAKGLAIWKRKALIPVLVPIYKIRGTAEGIENAVAFFLGKTVTVALYVESENEWTLGESELGFDTYLGISSAFALNSFVIEHTMLLTDEEKDIITEIVERIRLAHTHFLGFVYNP